MIISIRSFKIRTAKRPTGKSFFWLHGLIVFLIILKLIFSRFGHINIVQKIKDILIGVWHGLISVRALKNKPLFFFYTIGYLVHVPA